MSTPIIQMSGKGCQSVESTGIKADDEKLSRSPEVWKHLEAKYLKYIALLKSKAEKARRKARQEDQYGRLALWIHQKAQVVFHQSFRAIHSQQYKILKQRAEFQTSIQIPRNRSENNSKIVSGGGKTTLLVNDPKKSQGNLRVQPKKVCRAKMIEDLISLRTGIESIPEMSHSDHDQQWVTTRVQNVQLRSQIARLQDSVASLTRELQYAKQRMEIELLKKSCALVESEMEAQERQDLIKEYQIRLEHRTRPNNKVLVFTLEDFEVERKRMETINQRLFKQFQATKETFLEELKNQNLLITQLRSTTIKSTTTISENLIELQSLRAYKFQTEYQKECRSTRNPKAVHSPHKLVLYNQTTSILQILTHIENVIARKPMDLGIHLKLSSLESSSLRSIEESIQSNLSNQNTIKSKTVIMRMNSLQKSILLQQNVRVSNEDFNSFLDAFETPPVLSVDPQIQEQLEGKILSLNSRLFLVRDSVLSLLQSIQLKNPTKYLVDLIQSIAQTFQFSDTQKQGFFGGQRRTLGKMFW